MTEAIEAEVVEEETEVGKALAVQSSAPTLFGTDDPGLIVEKATALAQTLKDVLVKQKLITNIKGRDHVRVEGWTLLGTMLGVFPKTDWTHPIKAKDGRVLGWEARVVCVTRDGTEIGGAEAECLHAEQQWAGRESYALRSMAQTRAVSKALRQPLGFVVSLAGFDPTPAEEMTSRRPRFSEQEQQADQEGAREARIDRVKELSGKLRRSDPNWTKTSIISQAVAVTGDETIKDWKDLPDEALVQLVAAGERMLNG
jgi:hypothetical protein